MFQLATLLFLWLAQEARGLKSYVYMSLATFVAGTSLYFYVGARSFVVFFPVLLLWYWFFSRESNQKKIISVVLATVIISLVSLPMLFQITKDQFAFLWRLQEVSIIHKDVPVMTNIAQLANNGFIYLRVVFDAVDRNLRHNPMGTTIFPYYLGLLVPIGLSAMILKNNLRKQGVFLCIGLLATMAGGILSKEAPSFFRILGSIPLMSICIAVTIYYVQKLKKVNSLILSPSQLKVVSITLLCLGLAIQLIGYYQLMLRPSVDLQEAFSYPEQEIAKTIINSKTDEQSVYIAADYQYSSTLFLTLPANAFLEYQLFDVDSLFKIDRPAVLVLDSAGRGLQELLESFFSINRQYEVQTYQVNLPIVYEVSPVSNLPANFGLTVICDDGKKQLLERQSLGIYHSFATFPEGVVNCSWHGTLFIDKAGEYRFRGNADDGLSLQLASSSGVLLIDQPLVSSWERTITLDLGFYEVWSKYKNQGGARAARLEWMKPSDSAYEVIDPLAFHQIQKYE